MTTAVRRRRAERRGAAIVRAVGAQPSADLRGGSLLVGGRRVGLASPHLAADLGEISDAHARGIADSLGLLVRHSDLHLHRELAPEEPLERVVFDLLEQIRCESLKPAAWTGMDRNLDAAFAAWSEACVGERIAESGVGLLVFTVTHMARTRLIRSLTTELIDEMTEGQRFTLAPLIGEDLAALRTHRLDQRTFAFHARAIAEAVALVAGDANLAAAGEGSDRSTLLLSGWDDDDEDGTGVSAVGGGGGGRFADLDHLGDYTVFTREFDRETSGDRLLAPSRLPALRAELDQHRKAQAVSPSRVAQRLTRLLARPAPDGWTIAEEDGEIDPARLAMVVTDPVEHRIFRQPRMRPLADVAVTFLVDSSGSMKQQRYEAAAVLVDTFAQALDLAGAAVEVLGFTTRSWAGGNATKAWKAAGSPAAPGRVAEVEHIVYKDAGTTWRRARRSLAAMLSVHHYREGLDGEALVWAYRRLATQGASRRLLVLVSDGAPMETSTATANRDGFLDDHLGAVAAALEQRGDVEVGALTLEADLSGVFARSQLIDLSGTLSLSHYEVLADLFG
ncbi:MAG: cobalt chelatase [Actinomycetota bacterium]